MQHPAPLFAALTLLAACQRTPADLSACEDPACQQRWLEQTLTDDPARAIETLRTLPAGIERDTMIQLVMSLWPEHSEALCDQLSVEQLRSRCEAITHRPHLWQVDEDDPESGAMGAGRAYPVLAVEVDISGHPWNQLEPEPVACEEGWADNSCVVQTAISRAKEHHYQDAWRICLGAEQEKWRYECFFQVSEHCYDPKHQGDPIVAAEMCLASGYYQDRCLGHFATLLGHFAPPASSGSPDRWNELSHNIQRVEGALARYSDELAIRWGSLSWALAMDAAYSPDRDPVGNPIQYTPPAAMPHIAASVAWSLWQRQGGRVRDLPAWLRMFRDVMELREVDGDARTRLDIDDENRESWSENLPGEESIQWVVYRGPIARRAIGTNPESDALICIIEAAGRKPTAHRRTLFLEAAQHPDPLVRWTAVRLMGERSPQMLAELDPSQESDPLVRGRIEWGLARVEEE